MKLMIAGASGGVGQALTRDFDTSENKLILTYNESKNNIYIPKHAEYEIIGCDFTKKDEVIKTFSKVDNLHVLINTMGVVENSLIYKMEEGEWDRVYNANVKTIFLSCRYAIDKMINEGHIINISSVLSRIGMIGASNYASAKGAVEAFTRSFALECIRNKKRKIFVNAIALGYFKVGMGLNLSEDIVKLILKRIPIESFGEPEEIIKLVKYIISSNYLVGQVIHLNGGLWF